jgi:two-component system, cell cycle sensor histidine kinase and response regulator CckA
LHFPEALASVAREPEALQVVQHDLIGREAVLVVEDDQGVREFAACVLSRYGYRVREAGSAAQALLLLERLDEPIDLLITDLIMPDMTGCELVDHFHPAHPGARLLYMSGYTDEMIVQHGISVATREFLQKPFTSTELLQKVRAVLDADPDRNPDGTGALM